MPATSKKQQKFMGIVHAIQKGEQPASKFSKVAQKAAKSMKKKSAEDYASTKHKGLPTKVKKEERDYKAEYKKFQSSTKAKKYRAELNQYNRKRGTYGNGDGKDASHKGGKIVGFEKESKNRGRAEKSRLKKEAIFEDLNDAQLSSRIKHWAGQHKGTGVGYGHVLGSLAIHLKEMGWDKSFKEIVKVAKELSKKKKVESVFAVKGKEGKDGYRIPENPDFKYDPEKKESVNEGKWSKIMRSVRKGSKAGPWSIVVYDKRERKVKHQRLVKILQQIPAHYEDVKKKYPRDKIGIEDKYGERVYTESVNETSERDYKAEYKKYGSSTKAKKYRAELNQYNRKKGTYGNNDGKDASHKGGKIVGFEAQSKNRGRAEKSRLKKEDIREFSGDQGIHVYLGGIVNSLRKAGIKAKTAKQMKHGFSKSRDKIGFFIDVLDRKREKYTLQLEIDRDGDLWYLSAPKDIKLGKWADTSKVVRSLKAISKLPDFGQSTLKRR